MEGVFIALDGTDAAATETQFALLTSRLREAGHDVETFNFPQFDQSSSHFVREYLSGRYGSDEDVGPYTGSLLYALDMYHAAPQIRQAVKAGKVVFAHRYTASTMAEHGKQFLRPEERRGFFLWLESMETRMLGLPRPATNIVLRSPAAASSDGSLDILAESYDDLCRLFPKDYWRLDSVRSNEVLPAETIHSLILAKITPLLPAPIKKSATEPAPYESARRPEIHISDGSDILHITVQDVSSLLAAEIYADRSLIVTRQSGGPHKNFAYYVPDELDTTTRSEYTLHLNRILTLHAEMTTKLTEHMTQGSYEPEHARLRAYDILSSVLPAAATSTLDVVSSESDLRTLILRLRSRGRQEATSTADKILEAAHQKISDASRGSAKTESADNPAQLDGAQKVTDIASKYLTGTYAVSDSAPVELVSISPRNELELVSDMLYEHGALPLLDIRRSVATWRYEQKAEVMQAYIGGSGDNRQPLGNALEKARYGFDVMTDYATFHTMQRLRIFDDIRRQSLTPRYGFDVPDLIDEAGLTDDFEECFAISLKLHGLMQQAGFTAQSEYATLGGHKLRMQLQFSARQTCRMLEKTTDPRITSDYQRLVPRIHEKLAEYHPLIAEAITTIVGATRPDTAPQPAEHHK